ncbi:MAG: CheR family methyltransferase [Nitrospinota bacterium]
MRSRRGRTLDFPAFLQQALPGVGLRPQPLRRKAIRRRLARRMRELGVRSYSDYARLLEEQPPERERLRKLLTLSVSRFFRNRPVWDALRERVLPALLESLSPGESLRVLSAGCASGEEAYSLSLLWLARFEERAKLLLLASDLEEEYLRRARKGVYRASSLREVPRPWVESFFERGGEGFRVPERARSLVRFLRADLLSPLPFRKPFHLVLCRNTAFTYFAQESRSRALAHLAEGLAPGGALLVGRKERLSPRECERAGLVPLGKGFYRKGA